ncbi:MAG TPA: hypothetical protein VF162_15780 [Streptosporangiaceae bacterium]
MTANLKRAVAFAVLAVLALLPLAGPAAGATHHPQRRQLAVTTLSRFKVVLTATRVKRLDATATAAGYRHTRHGWKLIATKRIGKAAAWSWFATDVCNLKVAQFKPEPSSARPADSITVLLLWGPAIGCLGPYSKTWRP